jgi:hypothetical protein
MRYDGSRTMLKKLYISDIKPREHCSDECSYPFDAIPYQGVTSYK